MSNNLLEKIEQFKKDEYYDFGFGVFPIINEDESFNYSFSIEFEDIISPYLFKNICYGEGPYEFSKVILKENDVVLDCGANIGMFSLVAAAKGCKVYEIEPILDNIKYLSLLNSLNPNLFMQIVPFAVSNFNGRTDFYQNTREIGRGTINEIAKDINNYDHIIKDINVITIDDLVKFYKLNKVDFIKADIEGGEEGMLLGAQETLKTYEPKLSICTYHLPTSKQDIRDIILSINPNYNIIQLQKKLYAYVDKE